MSSLENKDPRDYFPSPEAEIIEPTGKMANDILVNGEFIGGCDIVIELYESGELKRLVEQ